MIFSIYRRGFWVRFGRLGRGFSFHWNAYPPLFSERYGYRKVHRFGPFSLEILEACR